MIGMIIVLTELIASMDAIYHSTGAPHRRDSWNAKELKEQDIFYSAS
jgi:hypothetical protein